MKLKRTLKYKTNISFNILVDIQKWYYIVHQSLVINLQMKTAQICK